MVMWFGNESACEVERRCVRTMFFFFFSFANSISSYTYGLLAEPDGDGEIFSGVGNGFCRCNENM